MLQPVSRQEFLPLLQPPPLVKVEFKGHDIKMEGNEGTPSSETWRSSATPQLSPPLAPVIQACKLLLLLMHGSNLETFTAANGHPQPLGQTMMAIKKLIDLCRIYDCAELLRPTVANYLHQYRRELFLVIKEDLTYHKDNWPWRTTKEKLYSDKDQFLLEKVKPKAQKLAIDCAIVRMKLCQNTIHVRKMMVPSHASQLQATRAPGLSFQSFCD